MEIFTHRCQISLILNTTGERWRETGLHSHSPTHFPLAFLVHFEEDNCLAYFLVNHSIQVLQWPFPPPCSKKILLEMTVCFIFSNVLIVNLKLIDPFSMQWQIVTYFSITFSHF